MDNRSGLENVESKDGQFIVSLFAQFAFAVYGLAGVERIVCDLILKYFSNS